MDPLTPVVPPTRPPTAPPPGWYADPWVAAGWRWWDGWAWTPYATSPYDPVAPYSTAGPTPEGERRWFPEVPSLPLPAAVLGIVSMIVLTIGTRAVTALPEVLAALLSLLFVAATVFGMPAVALIGAKKWGSGNVRRDLGLYAKLDDTWVGVIGMIALTISVVVVSVIIQGLGVPEGTNLEEVEEVGRNGLLFVFLVFFAGVVAPITEELLFRGLIQRGLTSRFGITAAIVIQGLVFGAAHLTPSQGWGNLTLIASLAVLGMLLGFITHLTGRLTAAMIAHSLFNCFQLWLLWLSLG